jgi:hypothetical protein
MVSINSQPSSPQAQTCILTNNSGIMTTELVTNIQVSCTDSAPNNWDEMNWDEGQWQ